jgi:hypothetical protein
MSSRSIMRVEVILRVSEKGGLASAEEKSRRGELIEPTIQRIGEKIKINEGSYILPI